MLSRRAFLAGTVLGRSRRLGVTLVHEHVLVDFIGADQVSRNRYDPDEVVRAALPHLRAAKAAGLETLVECTPAYLGRDPLLLQRLSRESGIQILTNTGYYGAANDKHLPKHAFDETPEQLAARWIDEALHGIEGTGIKPAFQKLGVDSGPLSAVDRKIIEAGCLTYRKTGLRMHVHTGNGRAAMDILDVCRSRNVPAPAFVWVHAQNEVDRALHVKAAQAGAWLEFDGINERSHGRHLEAVVDLWRRGYRRQLLISQDSGWYRVGEPGGGRFNGYTYLFEKFIPALEQAGFTKRDIRTLLVDNPAKLFG